MHLRASACLRAGRHPASRLLAAQRTSFPSHHHNLVSCLLKVRATTSFAFESLETCYSREAILHLVDMTGMFGLRALDFH